jgi:hypothetical protein
MSFQNPAYKLIEGGTPANNQELLEPRFFLPSPQRKSRLPALATSSLLHALLIACMMLWPARWSAKQATGVHRRYFVRFVQLETPKEFLHKSVPNPAVKAQARVSPKMQAAQIHDARPALIAGAALRTKNTVSQALPKKHRMFQLPPSVHVDAVTQTLVQMDIPPDVKLKQEVPLPTVLLWNQVQLPAYRKRFIAPPARKALPKMVQSLPSAPTLEPPNSESMPAELNVASVIPIEKPHLIQPPSVSSPVARTGVQPATEIPQIGATTSTQASAANLISLPMNPSHGSRLLVLPPANQVAASETGEAGSPLTSGNGAGGLGKETGSRGTGGTAATSEAGNRGGAGAANGNDMERAANGGSKEVGTWAASGSSGEIASGVASGLKRIDLPKEGKFSVVVMGSAAAEVYPESVGALSGKVVYTVYLKVGLRKSWILQYCLAKDGFQIAGRAATPIEAPWPFLIMRPDQWNAVDADYIIVHGRLTAGGKFDQLAMVFPERWQGKKLLLSALELWAFRPAKRDGVAVPVEVLLIIPREME